MLVVSTLMEQIIWDGIRSFLDRGGVLNREFGAEVLGGIYRAPWVDGRFRCDGLTCVLLGRVVRPTTQLKSIATILEVPTIQVIAFLGGWEGWEEWKTRAILRSDRYPADSYWLGRNMWESYAGQS